MPKTSWIEEFERAAISRNPDLVRKLRPGISEARIKRGLSHAKATGELGPIIAFYTWRDGTDLSLSIPVNAKRELEAEKAKVAFFPGPPFYYYLGLEMAVGHFGHLEAAAKNHPKLKAGVGRYFPVFWNGSTDWLALDISPSNKNRVILMEHEANRPFKEAYSSFDEFVADAIRANTENKPLRCFQNWRPGISEREKIEATLRAAYEKGGL